MATELSLPQKMDVYGMSSEPDTHTTSRTCSSLMPGARIWTVRAFVRVFGSGQVALRSRRDSEQHWDVGLLLATERVLECGHVPRPEPNIRGGLVLESVPVLYKDMIAVDGNSLYGTMMSELGIFCDRCVSSCCAQGLREKLGVDVPENANVMKADSMITTTGVSVTRTADTYLGIAWGGPPPSEAPS